MIFQLPVFPTVVHRSLPVFLLAFSLGVIAIRFLPWLPPALWIACIAGVLLAILYRWREMQLPVIFILGLCWAGWHAANFQSMMIPKSLEKKDLVVIGTIVGLVTSNVRGSSFDFEVETLEFNQSPLENPGKIRLSSYEQGSDFQPDTRWRLTVRLKRPRSLVNPGMRFDYAAWLYSKGITAKGYIVKGSASPVIANPDGLQLFRSRVSEIRKGFSAFVSRQSIGVSEQAVFSALSVGVRNQMDTNTWRVLRDTGTAHLVAISGLHIGLVALIAGLFGGLFWSITGPLRRRISKPSARWLFGLGAALIYATLAGFPLPTQRAITMLAAASIVVFCRKIVPAGWLLSIALSAVLLLNPLAPLANSFWLSFVAVTILIFSFRNREPIATESVANSSGLAFKFLSVLKGWVQMQLWLFIGMIPLLSIGFQQISLVAPLANLIAVPVIGLLIVPLVLLALFTWALGFDQFSSVTIDVCAWLFGFIWHALLWLSEQPFAIWQQGAPSWIAIMVAIGGFLLLVFGRILPRRWLASVWLLPLFFQSSVSLEPGLFRYTLLDVGQGLASVVQTQNHTMVFDTGAKYASGFDLGESVVVPFLRTKNVQEIDRLLVSHGDNDHAGGVNAVVAAIETRRLISGDPNSDWISGSATPCRAGQTWQWDGVSFEVLWPSDRSAAMGNDASCVLRVSSEFGSLLLTGDIEKSTERRLLESNREALSVDILQIPHHGSLTSSTPEFIRAVDPQVAMNSSGYLNRFGHPHSTVLQRYETENVPVLTTAEQGAIEATFDASGIHIDFERARALRFWRDKEGSIAQFSLTLPNRKSPSDIIAAG